MAGRKDKYETHVRCNFDRIDKWLNEGASEKNIAEKLGIAYSTWNTYKQKHQEFNELCSKPREALIDSLLSALIKKALGFEYEEKKQYIKEDKETGKKFIYTEITTKTSLPDTTAIFGALRRYDTKDNKLCYDYQSQSIDLKRQELELKKLSLEQDKKW
ncbi:MAG: hypothetical protein SPJ27_04560 [Candidatus Onthovivens sp.]|nr:hypothetical protein [Candidatus Onthovivens sp.]